MNRRRRPRHPGPPFSLPPAPGHKAEKMTKKTRRFGFALLSLLAAGPAHAGALDFAGHWENASHDASGISHVAISPAGGNHLSVRVYGDCHPTECDWGMAAAQSYSSDPHSGDVTSISTNFNSGFAHRQIIFRRGPYGGLDFQMLTDFSDRSGRQDFEMNGRLRRTAWAGPVGQNWAPPPAQRTGWGGGAHGEEMPKPREDCIGFDLTAAQTVQQGGIWKVMAGDRTLVGARSDERDALRALEVIRHYRLNRQCRAGATVYWKRDDTIPSGRMGGADCTPFNATTAHTAHIGQAWKIVDGVQWIADFGTDKAAADQMLSLIRTYRLERECFVARPNPAMVYWLSP